MLLIQLNLLNFLHTRLKYYPSTTLPSLNNKKDSQGFFLPDDFSLDLHTLQLQQTQDPVLKTVYHWIRHNTKPEYPTPLKHGSPFLHAY